MPAIFELDRFGELPLYAQSLIATRLTRRFAGAFPRVSFQRSGLDHWPLVVEALDALERLAFAGTGLHTIEPMLLRAGELRFTPPPGLSHFFDALWLAIDASRAADAAHDFPVDGTVSNSAHGSIAAIMAEPRVSRLQVLTLMASDLDQIRFACGEAKVGRYDGLTSYVAERLAPVHPLTLDAHPPRRLEDEYR